jgi:hypothetical protein
MKVLEILSDKKLPRGWSKTADAVIAKVVRLNVPDYDEGPYYAVVKFERSAKNDRVVLVSPKNIRGVKKIGTAGKLALQRPSSFWIFYDKRIVYRDDTMDLTLAGNDVQARVAAALERFKSKDLTDPSTVKTLLG